MADVELIIKIPETTYTTIKDFPVTYSDQLIADGQLLPKGHGDLIDRRELKKDVYTTTEWNGDVHRIIYEASVNNASTILETDRSDEASVTPSYNSIKTELKSCEDCISREQAKVAIRDRFKDLPSRVEINTILNELPSATPQPKAGHWIDTGSGQECSECGEIQYGYDNFRFYCAKCGSKNVIESESD